MAGDVIVIHIMNGRGAIFQIDLSQQSLLNNLYLSQSVEGANTLNNNIFFLLSNILQYTLIYIYSNIPKC